MSLSTIIQLSFWGTLATLQLLVADSWLEGRNRGPLSVSYPIPVPPGVIPGGGSGGSGGNGGSSNPRGPSHPLDPLTEEEISATSSVINNYRRGGNLIFNSIALKEPPKAAILPYFLNDETAAPHTVPRKSFTTLVDLDAQKMYEVVVNIDTRQVESWNTAPASARPLLTLDMLTFMAEDITKKNDTVRDRCRKLGYSNMNLVWAEPWSMGYVEDRPEYKGKWVFPVYMYGKHSEWDNQNAHPFDFIVIVDLAKQAVVNIEDLPTHDDFDTTNKEGNTVPPKSGNFDPAFKDSSFYRKDLKPVNVSQDGTSFSLDGYELKWQKFKMRIGFNHREGIVLYKVSYNDTVNGIVRPLFYRMSTTEMFINYGDPRPPFHRKYVFDEGQYGLGFLANTLNAGEDCLGEVRFFDGIVNTPKGDPRKIPRVICIREEDAGTLWKHTEFRTGRSSIVRSQRLAMSFVATIGHYDYIFTWGFYQDGKIEFNVKLTGIPSANMMAVNATPAGHGTSVAPQVNTQHHQHFFSIRVDPEIDGNKNTVSTADVIPGPGGTGSATNPYGNGFTTKNTVLRTASEGKTNTDYKKSRSWLISNPANIHPYTKSPVSWLLHPFVSPPVLIAKDSPLRSQMGWTDYNTWVLPYKEDQFYSGGQYLNGSGLPVWVGNDPGANIENTDVVIWHNVGITHIVRAEDWPVMPEETISVSLKPYNFFKADPALDVPGPQPKKFHTEL